MTLIWCSFAWCYSFINLTIKNSAIINCESFHFNMVDFSPRVYSAPPPPFIEFPKIFWPLFIKTKPKRIHFCNFCHSVSRLLILLSAIIPSLPQTMNQGNKTGNTKSVSMIWNYFSEFPFWRSVKCGHGHVTSPNLLTDLLWSISTHWLSFRCFYNE